MTILKLLYWIQSISVYIYGMELLFITMFIIEYNYEIAGLKQYNYFPCFPQQQYAHEG